MATLTHLVNKITKLVVNKTSIVEFIPEQLEALPYETPYFLISKDKVLENYREFKEFFPDCSVQYAMKANSESEVLQILAKAGCGFEVASEYELNWLKKINADPNAIVYGTSVKPARAIKAFYDYGVRRYAFDSFPELDKIAANAPGSKVYVRTIANDTGSVFKFSEKFGTDQASIIPLLVKAKQLNLVPYGISFHVGSQASDVDAWANVILSLRSIIQDLQEMDITLEALDLGGGFPCQYATSENVPTLPEIADSIYAQYKKLPYHPHILLEPGRGMVADTSIAVGTVIARIERRGNTWLFLDLGVYNGLFETMAYQGSTRYPVTSMRPVGSDGESLFALAGPTGDSPDVITREALLPSNTEVGDKLIFHNVGAYSLTATTNFNGFPPAKAYVV